MEEAPSRAPPSDCFLKVRGFQTCLTTPYHLLPPLCPGTPSSRRLPVAHFGKACSPLRRGGQRLSCYVALSTGCFQKQFKSWWTHRKAFVPLGLWRVSGWANPCLTMSRAGETAVGRAGGTGWRGAEQGAVFQGCLWGGDLGYRKPRQLLQGQSRGCRGGGWTRRWSWLCPGSRGPPVYGVVEGL